MKLTKDTDKVICIIYKEYLIKSDTLSKSESKFFTSDELEKLLSEFDTDDIDDFLNELKLIKFIDKYITGDIVLTKDCIIYMENRFKKGLKEVIEFITKFIS